MHPSKTVLAAVALSGLVLAGCHGRRDRLQPTMAELRLAQARVELQHKNMQLAALGWYSHAVATQLQAREAQLVEARQAERFGKKLDEPLVLNQELQQRLVSAEEALTQIHAGGDGSSGAEHLPPSIQRQLEELRQLREHNERRSEAYRQLANSLQVLVDSGRLRIVIDPQGQVRVHAPALLDQGDPWRDEQPLESGSGGPAHQRGGA